VVYGRDEVTDIGVENVDLDLFLPAGHEAAHRQFEPAVRQTVP
jgi:hypothetical protein